MALQPAAHTREHGEQVLDLVLDVCERMGLDMARTSVAEFAALLHDVGKLRIPAEIVEKPGPLTPMEHAIMKTHTVEGERLLMDVAHIVRSCHERWDGAGYPDGLTGVEIPLLARIVFCCDAYDAMMTARPYRPSLGRDRAIAELRANQGTQFDAVVVDAMLAALDA